MIGPSDDVTWYLNHMIHMCLVNVSGVGYIRVSAFSVSSLVFWGRSHLSSEDKHKSVKSTLCKSTLTPPESRKISPDLNHMPSGHVMVQLEE